MELQIDLAIRYARAQGIKINLTELSKAMFPEAKQPYHNLRHLRIGKTRTITIDMIEAIVRVTGIPVEMLIQ